MAKSKAKTTEPAPIENPNLTEAEAEALAQATKPDDPYVGETENLAYYGPEDQ